MKIVINTCYGGFGISDEALKRYNDITGKDIEWYGDLERDDVTLIKLVEEMGAAVNDTFSNLKIVEIPNTVYWEIEEYDGKEWVAEKHRVWS